MTGTTLNLIFKSLTIIIHFGIFKKKKSPSLSLDRRNSLCATYILPLFSIRFDL